MFHGVAADEGACAPETRLAVDGQNARVALAHLEEFLHYGVGRSRTINEKHVCMADACLSELGSVVFGLVESDDVRHAEMAKDLQVVFWAVASAIRPYLIDRPHECNELPWQNPVEITVFHLFVVLVLLVIEFPKVVPTETHSDFEALETVENGAAVGAVAVAGVAKRSEAGLVGREGLPGDLSGLTQNHDHKGPHEVCSIRLLIILIRCVMKQFDIFVAFIGKYAAQLPDKLVRRGEVRRPKI